MKNVLAYSINVPTKTPQLGADPELVLCTTNSVLYKWNRASQVWVDISTGGGDSIIVVDDSSATLKPDGLSLILGSKDSGAGVDRSIEMIPDDATADIQFNNSDGGFEFNSTTGGLVPPRMTTAQRDAIPDPIEDGTIIRNIDDNETQQYNANTDDWEGLVPPGGGGGSGVVSLSGSGVDNSDPHNPVVNARPYLVYTALLSQSGTSAPVATVLENTIGDIVWTRDSAGSYFATLTGAFVEGKTWALSGPIAGYSNGDGPYLCYIRRNDSNTILLQAGGSGEDGDNYLNNQPIEIRVYP